MNTEVISSYGNTHSSIEVAEKIGQLIEEGKIADTPAWEATTNRKRCGGMNSRCRAVIHRALRRAGYHFYLAVYDDNQGNSFHKWGIIHENGLPALLAGEDLVALKTGYTLSHAAHKLGRGNAAEGWKFFWSF